MRGGKEEGKVTSPMFPRLHVNDKEKGGPRAPPRNKMALYEQLSIPSHRSSSGSATMLPLPPPNGTSLVSSMSSSNGGHERSVFTQLCNSPAPSFSAEKLHSYSSNGIKLNNMMANQERKSVKPSNYQCLNAAGPLSSNAKSSSPKPSNFSNFRHFSLRKPEDEDDLRVSSAQLGISPHCRYSQQRKDRKFNQKKGSALGDIKSGPRTRNQNDDNTSQTSPDPVDNYTSIPLNTDRNLADGSSIRLSKVRHLESLKRAHSSLNQENRSSSKETLNSLRSTNSRLHQECVALRDEVAHNYSLLMETARDIDKDNAFKVRTESCLRPSFGDYNSSPKELENVECHEDKNERSVQVREVDKQDNVSNTYMVGSVSALGVSPDDVVGVIGEKQFWKARRAIIDQQRVFTLQVFELHRLLKVQRLIARSPNLLLEDNLCVGKPPLNTPQAKLRSESVLRPLPCIVKAKYDSSNSDPGSQCADDNAVANIPHPFINNDTSKGFVTQQSNNGSCSGNVPSAPGANLKNIKQTPWCFPPPGNQWLVSVMSPSEGLVYKPYTGPCPPTTGFVAPFYGSRGPVSLNPTGADFLNTAYGVPASHQEGIGILPTTPPLGQTGFPPYGMPVMNQSISGTAVDQMIPFPPRGQSKDNHLSMVDINFMIPHQSSRNMSSQMSRVISSCLEKFQASKESEVQASTASSPSERAKGDALPLFPMVPIVQASDQNDQTGEQQARVIKVVPCNPRLAPESAARIFRSIQEERKQYD